jgi:hypothetical protein
MHGTLGTPGTHSARGIGQMPNMVVVAVACTWSTALHTTLEEAMAKAKVKVKVKV